MNVQNQANPWISERLLGSVGNALQCAEEAGVIRKVLACVVVAILSILVIFDELCLYLNAV